MDSDLILKEDGTAEIAGDRFKVSVADIEMFYRGGHLTTADGNIELTSDAKTFKISSSNFQLFYYGGHLVTHDGNVELGSTDGGTLKGFAQDRDGMVRVQGDAVRISANAVAEISASNLVCRARTLSVLNPDVRPAGNQQRVALKHGAADELVLNEAAHYTGGVRVEGKLDLRNEVMAHDALKVDVAGKLLLMQPDIIMTRPGNPPHKIHIPVEPMDVLQTIKALQATVQDLTERLAAVEQKVR